MKMYRTNYDVATHWLNGSLIRCNNIGEIDPTIFENMQIPPYEYDYDNSGIEYNEDGYDENGYDEEGYDEDGYNEDGYNREGYNESGHYYFGYDEIFQYFLTSYSESDVKWMQETFPCLLFTYSEKLDLYVLCVTHWGTSWDCVMVETTCENAQAEENEDIEALRRKWDEESFKLKYGIKE